MDNYYLPLNIDNFLLKKEEDIVEDIIYFSKNYIFVYKFHYFDVSIISDKIPEYIHFFSLHTIVYNDNMINSYQIKKKKGGTNYKVNC